MTTVEATTGPQRALAELTDTLRDMIRTWVDLVGRSPEDAVELAAELAAYRERLARMEALTTASDRHIATVLDMAPVPAETGTVTPLDRLDPP
jgi:hypothetical protein